MVTKKLGIHRRKCTAINTDSSLACPRYSDSPTVAKRLISCDMEKESENNGFLLEKA